MDRKSVVAMLSALVLCAAVAGMLAGCGSSASSSPSGDFDVASSVDGGHSHSIRVLEADLDSQPAAGVIYTSSSSAGHTHTVALSQADLATIGGGGTVAATSSVNGGHSHTWTIRKP